MKHLQTFESFINEAAGSIDLNKINLGSLKVAGIDKSDHPDYVDAYVTYARYKSGKELTDAELDMVNDDENIRHQLVMAYLN